jgi:hypothetical protein
VVAIVVEYNLCDYAGTLSRSILAAASKYYEVTGLCKKLMISYLEIHCNSTTDPIQPFLIQAGINAVCVESKGYLKIFVDLLIAQSLMPMSFISFAATTSPEAIRLGALILELFAIQEVTT